MYMYIYMEEMAIHCTILAWRLRWTEEPSGLQSMGVTELDTTKQLSTHTHTHTHVNYYRAVAYRLKLYIMAHLWKPCFPHNEH